MGQLGEIRDKLKAHFETLKPDMVMVFGDVTSTLAASLSATMLHIPVVHVESGLRSFDLTMPEEVNRLLVDFLSTFLFVTEQSGVENLQREGITKNVFLVGNTMIDTQKKYLQQALSTQYHKKLGLNEKEYVLVTLHRPSNVDNIDTFNNICRDLIYLSKKHKIVYPLHPRTRQNLEKTMYGRQFTRNTHILLEEPLGYLELTCLLAHCTFIITDSGGLQEESTGLGVPCFTLRENTERPSTLIENGGTNQLIHQLSDIQVKKVCVQRLPFWDGYTARHIQHILTTG
jgi:UDP-N-acetylglucosamine 2-epimerase (non-hydrolysing)